MSTQTILSLEEFAKLPTENLIIRINVGAPIEKRVYTQAFYRTKDGHSNQILLCLTASFQMDWTDSSPKNTFRIYGGQDVADVMGLAYTGSHEHCPEFLQSDPVVAVARQNDQRQLLDPSHPIVVATVGYLCGLIDAIPGQDLENVMKGEFHRKLGELLLPTLPGF